MEFITEPEFWVAVSFIIFLGVLFYFGVHKKLATMLDARALEISKELAEARRLREEAEKVLADYRRKEGEAANEAGSIIALAAKEAEMLAAETRKSVKEHFDRRMKLAEEKQAYVMWGAFPFLRFKQKHDTGLNILVSADPVLQRVMAAVVVKPDKVKGVNVEGAEAFVTYLLAPATQAKIAAFRSPGSDLQLWWPAARDNSVDHLDD